MDKNFDGGVSFADWYWRGMDTVGDTQVVKRFGFGAYSHRFVCEGRIGIDRRDQCHERDRHYDTVSE